MPDPRGTRQQRGYDAQHDKLRAELLPHAIGKPCARCGHPMLDGQKLHLDHRDDRVGYLGFSHARCNVAAANRLHPKPRQQRPDEPHPGDL